MIRPVSYALWFLFLIAAKASAVETNVPASYLLAELEHRISTFYPQQEDPSGAILGRNIDDMQQLVSMADDALLVKAECLEQLKKYDEAIDAYEQAMKCFPDGRALRIAHMIQMNIGGQAPGTSTKEREQFEQFLANHPDFITDLALLGVSRCQEKKGDVVNAERTLLMVLEGRTAKEWKQQDKKYAESFVKFYCFRPATIAGLRLYALYKQNKKWKEALRLVDQYGVPCDTEELKQLRGMANGK